jgi:ethanolamine utilization protein EutA (predicted chaperonin)
VQDHHPGDHGLTEAERLAMAEALWRQETLRLLTVGIDIGSSTSHLVFARVLFQRQGHRAAARFLPVERLVHWRSPIMLTPFLPDGTIDADALSRFFRRGYADAGLTPGDVDTGAVILTGEAIKRRNARAITEIFADEAGKIVTASAGHRLESTLAAYGSGATALSATRGARGLHVDIGGGTTKLALVDNGEILGVAAFAVGGRLIARDAAGRWTRVAESAALTCAELGIETSHDSLADPGTRRRVAGRLADLIADQVAGGPADALGAALQLTEPLPATARPEYLTFSGGVAEYLFGHGDTDHGDTDHGDIGRDLAAALAERLPARGGLPVVDPGQRIRATVIGASQFSAQLSGSTIHRSGASALPVRNVPVVRVAQPLPEDIDPAALAEAFTRQAARHDTGLTRPVALSLAWSGPVTYPRLAAVAQAVVAVVTAGGAATDGTGERADEPLILLVDADVAQALGAILTGETGLRRRLIVIDGVELTDFDFIDVGEYQDPPGVLPVLIKSLLFAGPEREETSRSLPVRELAGASRQMTVSSSTSGTNSSRGAYSLGVSPCSWA